MTKEPSTQLKPSKSSLPEAITKEKLLLVEGKDEQEFFKAVFCAKGIEGIQIIPTHGKAKFRKIKAFVTLSNQIIVLGCA